MFNFFPIGLLNTSSKVVHSICPCIRAMRCVFDPGVWARDIGRTAGVKVPLVAMKHAYVVTEKIDGIQRMPNVRDHDASVYLKLQGDALGVGGYELNPVFWEKVATPFTCGSLFVITDASCVPLLSCPYMFDCIRSTKREFTLIFI